MKTRNILIACFLLALCARILVVLFVTQNVLYPDERRYWTRAVNIIENGNMWGPGGGFALDMPLLPMLLAGIHALGGDILAGKLTAAFLGSLAVFPVGLLARRLFGSRLSVGLAGLVAALYPHHIYFSALILSEPLFFLLVPTFFLSVFRQRTTDGTRGAAVPGLFAGLAHLTRPTLLYFLPVVALWSHAARKISWRRIGLAALVFCVVVSPWVARNWMLFGTPMLTTTGSGQVLWEGNNPWNTDGGVARPDWGYLKGLPHHPDLTIQELLREKWKKKKAVAFIKSDPARFMTMAWKKILRFWAIVPNADSITSAKVRLVSLLTSGPLFLLALASLWVLRDRFRDTVLIWLFAGYYTALHMVTIGSIRYRLPLDTLLIALAAACLARLLAQSRRT